MSDGDRDGLRSLASSYDVYVPRFEVFVGPDDDAEVGEEIDTLESAIDRERRRIDERIARSTSADGQPTSAALVPLAGGGDRPTNDVRSITFTESVEEEGWFSQVQVEVHNVYDAREQRFHYTDRLEQGSDSPLLDYGKALVLRIGYRDALETVFEGLITELDMSFPADGGPSVRITAIDKRDRLRALRPEQTESVTQATEEQIAAQLLRRARLRLAKRTSGQRTPVSGTVRVPRDQDLSTFIRGRAQGAALEMGAFGNTMFLLTPGDREPAELSYRYREGLISFKPTFNAAGVPVRVEVRARSADGSTFEAVVDANDLASAGLAPSTQGELALRALAGGGDDARVLRVTNVVVQSAGEAKNYALGLLKRHLDRLFTAEGELLGDPRVRAGKSIDVEGVGRFSGTYYVTSATHSMGDGGYQTSFRARRNTQPRDREGR